MRMIEARGKERGGALAGSLVAVLATSVVLAGTAFTARPTAAKESTPGVGTKAKGPGLLGGQVELTADAFEPDNTPFAVGTISDGESQQRTLHTEDDVDWVRFTLTEAATVSVRTTGIRGDADTRLSLYGPGVPDEENGSNLRRVNDDDPTVDPQENYYYSAITAYNLEAGEYYVKVRPVADGQSRGAYTLSLDVTPAVTVAADSAEPDDTAAQASAVTIGGSAVTRTLHTPTDVDYFTFRVRRPTKVRITTAGIEGNVFGDTMLTLFKGRKVKGRADDVHGRDDFLISTYAELTKTLPPGVYTIAVRGYGDLVDPGYTLQVSKVGGRR